MTNYSPMICAMDGARFDIPAEIHWRAVDDDDALALPAAVIAARMGVSIVTARDWRRARRIPPMWRTAVRALLLGDLGAIDGRWAGWRLTAQGTLCAPDGGVYEFEPGEIRSIPLRRQQLALLQREAMLPRQSDWIDGRWSSADRE